MLSYLSDFETFFGPLRLFRYLSLRIAFCGLTSMFIGFWIGPWVIAKLKQLKMNQMLRTREEVGDLAELTEGKESTPTMGGFIICISVIVSVLLWAKPNVYVLTSLFVYAALTAVGFIDDYTKVFKKNSKGLSGKMKLFAQAGIALISVFILVTVPESSERIRELWLPFYKYLAVEQLPLYIFIPFFFIVLAGSSNAINLTDGIDGLAIGCTVTVTLAYLIFAYAAGNAIIADYLFISYIPNAGELAVVCSAILGASLAFLWYNSYPAEVFMGDTGSLALGGIIGVIALMIHQPFTLILVGGIFVAEALSVMLQVGSYKLLGKRIFKMSPIHHHFQLSGWFENKVVIRFWILSLLFAIAGIATLKLR
ncbi:MAG: phospho-N-acetylmuramoyl-pentapeptide-transferase [Puniceicoccaceae bacterium]|nr:phospho-N-acetylmuramoyl-pentapeptide-transferase [Puniceicoccaceae bacterium]